MPAAHASQLPVGDEEKFPAGQGVHDHEVPALEYSPLKHGSQVASLPPSEVWPGAHDMHSSPTLSYFSPTAQVDRTRRLAPGPRNVSASSPRPAPCASVETRPGVFATPTRCIRAATDASAMNPARV